MRAVGFVQPVSSQVGGPIRTGRGAQEEAGQSPYLISALGEKPSACTVCSSATVELERADALLEVYV